MQELHLPCDIKINTPFPLINAVLADLQTGKLFKHTNSVDSFYIIHKAGFSFLTNKDNDSYSDELTFLLQSDKMPVYFHLYDAPLAFIDLCNKRSEEVNIKIRRRVQLKFAGNAVQPDSTGITGTYTVRKISSDNFERLAAFNLSLESKFWKSKEDFEKNSFGFCVFNENDLPVSICYAACVVDNTAEIDVATLPEFQRKGLAKMAVSSFVQFCIDNKIIANWDCFEDNFGSLKTAESIGFNQTMTYNFLSIFNKRKNHETH